MGHFSELDIARQNADRDEKGRFLPGNRWAAVGFRAMCVKHFGGDKQAAIDWLVARALWVQDAGYREMGIGNFRDPGPHPAHQE